ncbi:MAG: formylglycine-generating enzyme family protein [Deltaproteobacteria bacterium]|nr:formylglycine-generating enzyme family protein [Deltaproteobacteria bacterium]
MLGRSATILVLAAAAACSSPSNGRKGPSRFRGTPSPISRAADQAMVRIPSGGFVRGSTPEEREAAYNDYLNTSGRDTARRNRWFARERDAQRFILDPYSIDLTPVSNAAYAEFVRDTGHRAPFMDETTWKRQGYIQKWPDEVERFVWTNDEPPLARAEHPVVLVSWDDALAYCKWRGDLVGADRRLPTAAQFEKAARGPRGRNYPWGPSFEPDKLNSAVKGPRDTTAVGTFPDGASVYGVLDAAGNVFQWTSTRWPFKSGRFTVKGSAWDDYGGLGRGAAEHGRPRAVRHAIVGFRCAGPARRRS